MEKIFGQSKEAKESRQEHWVSMSDLMAGLMMVFMLIAITYLRLVHFQRQDVEKIAYAHRESHQAILNALRTELPPSVLSKIHATIREDLSVEFQATEFSFDRGSANMPAAFQVALAEFFPRYLRVIAMHRENIQEVRIEGHTSSEWGDGELGPDEGYFKNMELSQGRTREVLRLCHGASPDDEVKGWIRKNFVAVGYSSAKAKSRADGSEDGAASRRVTFRIITNAETRIGQIISKFDNAAN